jgi:hypothetical protein
MTLVETLNPNKLTPVSVKPYFDGNVSNLGLEKYGLTLYDGVYHEEQLACIEMNGITRYLTGLNEFAPEIKKLDPEVREARIREIRSAVVELERELAANILDPEDKEFWNKVELLQPNNKAFWNKIAIRCGNDPLFLDPADPFDRIKLHAINAGGFSIVAKSLDDARSRAVPPKFYLDKAEETIITKTEGKKLRNKALSEMQKLYDKNSSKLFYVAKVVDAASQIYKKNTPNDVIYDAMDRFINGEGVETNKTRAANQFLDAAKLDMETLKIRSIVKDATFYKFIITKGDGYIYHTELNALLGRNVSDIVEFLKNPLHEDILLDLTKKVERNWNM